jgi:hypothetical protein
MEVYQSRQVSPGMIGIGKFSIGWVSNWSQEMKEWKPTYKRLPRMRGECSKRKHEISKGAWLDRREI